MSSAPAPVARLIGREAELELICSLMARSRLVTLTGPGGIGKTSLARAVEATAPDPHWFVDLALVHDEGEIAPTIAGVLGLVLTEAVAADVAVEGFLASRRPVLVLDNLEQLPSAGRLIARWLDVLPELRVLATSRVPLGIAAEVAHPVPGLGAPAEDTPSGVEASPAGALFLARARALGEHGTLEAPAAKDLAVVLRKLDGYPLAIELAAGRSRILTPAALLRRLADTSVLATTGRQGPGRHASLDAVLAMTLDLLPTADRRFLASLSVCPGSFDLDLAQALAGELPAIPALDRLVGAGLVRVDGEIAGERRFRLLEPIRSHVHLELSTSDSELARRRQAVATADLAERINERWTDDEAASVAILTAEDDNLAAAISWMASHDSDRGLTLLAALDRYLQAGVKLERSVRWCRQLLERASPDHPDRLLVTGSLLRLLVRYAGPAEGLKLRLAILAAIGGANRRVQRSTYLRLAHASYALGDLQATAEFNDLAAAASDDPDDAEALRLNAEALRAWIVDADADRAIDLHGRAAAADARAGATGNQGIELFKRAILELRAGHVGAAVDDARTSARLSAAGNLRAFALGILALGLAEQGAVDEASAAVGEAWREVEAEAPIDRIEALEAGVAVLAAAGRTSEALAVLAVADRERPATGWRRDVHIDFLLDRWRTQAARSLNPVRAGLAERAAQGLSVDAAMALALATPSSATPGRDRLDRRERHAPRTGLTTREVEVLALLGEGRSDGEIAAELFISPKTASVHVANIKGKLGLGSRLEVALRARELGLTAGPAADAGGRVH